MNIWKDWKAKLESAYSFMLKYSKITACGASSTVATLLEHTVQFINAMKYQILIFSRVSGYSI
jgi:hypothetical protein